MSNFLKIDLTPDTVLEPVTAGATIEGRITVHDLTKTFRLYVGPKRLVQSLELVSTGYTVHNVDDSDERALEIVVPPSAKGKITARFLLSTAGLVGGEQSVTARIMHIDPPEQLEQMRKSFNILAQIPAQVGLALGQDSRVTVSKESTTTEYSHDIVLSAMIKASSQELAFNNYKKYMDFLLCGEPGQLSKCVQAYFEGSGTPNDPRMGSGPLLGRRFLPFTDTDGYRFLKVATEAFVAVKSGVDPSKFRECLCQDPLPGLTDDSLRRIATAINATINVPPGSPQEAFKSEYLVPVGEYQVLPYLAQIAQKLRDLPLKEGLFKNLAEGKYRDEAEKCTGLLRQKLTCPVMLELIWSYWHEQGMLVQSMFAIRDRFQNRRQGPAPDPLAAMEIGYLRPLNNILWGYIQDEQHRLTLIRRSYEYDHHYGLSLQGKAITPPQTADSRSKFLEAFHNLLYLCVVFFKEDDDTNRKADAFPVLNAIKEVHFLLSEGAQNQFSDLPTTSRIEMLMEQWLLARPEMQQFLPSRESVAYPEDWMGPVDAMKTMQGWSNTSVMYFHDLAVFGEQILLSIRYNVWSKIIDRQSAANWARIWRSEIQGYLHAYRTVTGVDVSIEPTEARLKERRLDPSLLLMQRLQEQQRLGGVARGGYRLPPSPTANLRLPVSTGERRRGTGGQ